MNSINGFSKLSKLEKIEKITELYFNGTKNYSEELKKYWHPNEVLQKTIDEFSENTLSNLYNHLKTGMQRREASAKSRGFDAFEYKLSNLRASNDESIFKHVEIRNSLKIN